MTDAGDLGRIPSVLACRLSPEDIARLPPDSPPPPWTCEVQATVWWHPAVTDADALLPPSLRTLAGRRLTVGVLARYPDAPVGPYTEIAAAPVMLHARAVRDLVGAHVPFAAVDTLGSVRAGRAHWALPKGLATFGGEPGAAPDRAEGVGWWVRAAFEPTGWRFPFRGRLGLLQEDGEGEVRRVPLRWRGRVRRGRVDVDVHRHSDLAGWLQPGRHRGLSISGRLDVQPAIEQG
ncbi:hypothetical protein ER308_18310 [Egibacter rhizosphaerae]|uniref:Acetoacetate decarboxylase n=1 Tax=Egibacter rhizosphaerae TaxID=1670831 RepID=A0A411YJ67_9ACTN|nr:acetoacetate decarboxylase family protein [Egibacter rhizosphaerae]QBI21328.1 hypothetical protein ER308_18310 [Egibacter rhizosphaerae]